MSRTWQCWAKRSTRAATQAAPGKTVPHCLKGRLVVMTIDAGFVPAADDVVEQVGGAAVARQVAELVEDQEVGLRCSGAGAARGRASDSCLRRSARAPARRGEADGVAMLERGEPEVLGERWSCRRRWGRAGARSRRARGSRGCEQMLVELAVDRARVVPVEAVEGVEGAEGGGAGARGEVAARRARGAPARRASRTSRRARGGSWWRASSKARRASARGAEAEGAAGAQRCQSVWSS